MMMQMCLTHGSLKHTMPENYAMALEILKIQYEQNYELLTRLPIKTEFTSLFAVIFLPFTIQA